MKGFVQIIEVVIASVIVLSTASFFLPGYKASGEWDTISADITVKDALAVMHRSGMLDAYVKEDDASGMSKKLSSMLPSSVKHSAEITGVPNSRIYVGCISRCSDLREMVEPLAFRFKGRKMQIIIQPMTPDNILPGTDAFFIYGYQDLSAYRQQIDAFLKNGGAIVLLGDVTQDNINSDSMLTEIFGLQWSGNSPSQVNKFYDTTDPTRLSYRVANYFKHSYLRYFNGEAFIVSEKSFSVVICEDGSGRYVKFNDACNPQNPGEPKYREGDVFSMQGYEIKIFSIGYDYVAEKDYGDIGIADSNYDFKGLLSAPRIAEDEKTIVSNTAGLSAVKGNVFAAGRSLWFAGYDNTRTDINHLLKASILWASGEKYSMNAGPVYVPDSYREVRYISVSSGRDYEAYTLSLKYWWSFV